MENAIQNIRSGIDKREAALAKIVSLKDKFEKKKKTITNEITAARKIWKETEEQIPKIFY